MKATDLEVNVRQEFKGLSIETHIQQHLGVVHVVGELSWWREITEGHHLFGAVDDHRLIDISASRLRLLLQKMFYHFISLQFKFPKSEVVRSQTPPWRWDAVHVKDVR